MIKGKIGADELIDEVQVACGRSGDTELVTDTRVIGWLNEAQKEISERVPGLLALDLNEVNAFTCVSETPSYSLLDVTNSRNHLEDATSYNWVNHIFYIYFRNGSSSYRLDFRPNETFDGGLIDPTSEDNATSKPRKWARRGDDIFMYPLCDDVNTGTPLRMVGSWYPLDFTLGSSCQSDLDDADEGLILWATMKAWGRIGNDKGRKNTGLWRVMFENWLDRYKDQNNLMHEWDANLYGDFGEFGEDGLFNHNL